MEIGDVLTFSKDIFYIFLDLRNAWIVTQDLEVIVELVENNYHSV